MLAQTAIHGTDSGSHAADIAGGTGSKGKKAQGLASLFSEILSQAQKNMGGSKSPDRGKGADAAKSGKPAPEEKGKASSGLALRAQSAKSSAASVVAGAQAKAPLHPADVAAASTADAPTASRAADKRLAKDRRAVGDAAGEADGAEGPDSGPRKAEGDKRLAKAKATSEEDASLAALAAYKPSSALAAPKAKASGEQESDPSIKEKKTEKLSSEPKVTVLDLRRASEARKGAEAAKAEDASKDGPKDALRETKSDSGRELVRELSLDARAAGDSGGAAPSGKAEAGVASGRASDFQSMLADRMREAWNGEIVQSAHLVLKDGDAGTIRLRLRPESLGNVKIELNLADNNISGRILVESDEAKSAFERNMNELSDAFRQGGFDSASLQVSVGSSGGGAGGASGNGSGDPRGPFFSERLRVADGALPDAGKAASAYSRRGGSIDMLA
jgi:flagellar protein FlbC